MVAIPAQGHGQGFSILQRLGCKSIGLKMLNGLPNVAIQKLDLKRSELTSSILSADNGSIDERSNQIHSF